MTENKQKYQVVRSVDEDPKEIPIKPVQIFEPETVKNIMQIADMMASGVATIPKHLQKSTGDCFAIAMQAMQWGMNPYAVAQKTYLVNGVLGYEAQLVNAVVSSSKAINGRFYYQYLGDWKNHNIPGSDAAVRVGAILNGESDITWGEPLYPGDVKVKNSPLWQSAPKQQAGYLAVKYWARFYCPEVILGVYTADDMTEEPEKEINPTSSLADRPVEKVAALKQKLTQKTTQKEELKQKTDLHAGKTGVDTKTGEVITTIALDAVLEGINKAETLEALDLAVDTARSLHEDDKAAARKAYKEKFNLLLVGRK